MARYNEILTGRYNRFLQKLFQLKGEPPAPQLASEIMPIISFFSGAEHRYLESWAQFQVVVVLAAVAAQFGEIRLRNPTGSNVIAVFERIHVINNSATQINPIWAVGQTIQPDVDLSGVAGLTNSRLDKRGQPTPSCVLSSATQAGAAPNVGFDRDQYTLPANTHYDSITDPIHEFPLLPGDIWQIRLDAVNLALTLSLKWRERFLEEAERF